MKKAMLLTVAFLVCIPLGLIAQSDTPSDGYYAASFARLTFVNGEVFVQRTSDLGTEQGEVNMALVQGDKLGTGAGQVEVHFGRRNYLRLDNNSKVEFAILPTEGDDRIKIHVLEGSAYLRISSLSGEKAVEVHSPDVSSYILDEGLYRFNVTLNGQTEILVSEGSLEAAGEGGSVVVKAGESVAAEDGRLLGDPSYFTSRSDGFDQWNASRDSLLAPKSTTSYLPSDMNEYQDELDQNGRWNYERPYGYVWSPYGVGDDWRPYMNGRWSWYPNIGWNWISSESWGWSVYHYGRWQWRFGLGWYWIPQSHWGPAWVNWWWDNDYIGWCPLTWYNRPGVFVNNAFYDRYRDHYFPGNNRAMSVIRRDQLQSRDLGRHMLRGGELNRIDRVALQGGQPNVRPGIGRSSLQSPQASRIFSTRPGIRNEAKNFSPGNSISSSRLRQGNASNANGASSVSRSGERAGSTSSRSLGNRSGASTPAQSGGNIRSYPRGGAASTSSQGAGSRDQGNRMSGAPRSSGAGSGDSSARVYPSRRDNPASSNANAPKATERQNNNESKSSGSQVRSGERIKNYPSAAGNQSSALSPRSSSSSARLARPDSSLNSRTYPSRMSQGNSYSGGSSRSIPRQDGTVRSYTGQQRSAVGPSKNPSYSAPSGSYAAPSRSSSSYSQAPKYNPRTYSYSRPSSPSYSGSSSRSSSPRYSAPSQSRSSYSAPSRSSGSSGRSSYSAPRSSGSTSSRSSSSPRSSSSSGRSSGARKKG
ncbi:MAG: DUF6600 domain-containing protein [Candidatus Aminicenantales bacterium]